MQAHETVGGSPARPSAEFAPEALLTQSTAWRRWALTLLIVVVAAPVLPWPVIGVWLGLQVIAAIAEHVVVAKRGYLGHDAAGLTVAFAVSFLQALAAAALVSNGDGGTRFFAVALIGFSSIAIVLRYFNAPRAFIAAMTPHALVLALVAWGLFAKSIAAGDWLKALTPPAVLLTYVILLVPTRARLAATWHRLEAARLQAEDASRAKSDFLATMSHEIRTPLNGILGMAQAMQRAELPPEQKEQLRIIRRSGEGLLCLLNDALDFSQIEAGTLVLDPVEFDMEHLTRGAVATFTPLAAKKGLSFEFSIDDAAKGTFRGDTVRIRQILYNLSSNAVKFTEAGGVGVCVSYADGAIKLEVADSGIGIAADRIDGLFGQFVQGDASATRRHGGVGLGLAICRSLADLMGGTISVSSVAGKGSLFTVNLPMERLAAPAEVAWAPEPVVADEADGAPIRILAAEDNAVNQLVLRTLLSQVGLEPTIVENGAQAVEAWGSGHWDLILMDIQMPIMDGVTATRQIRALEASGDRPKTPIIAVTANAMSHQVAAYEAAGMDAVVAKPLDAAKLFEAIEQALEPQDDQRAAAAA